MELKDIAPRTYLDMDGVLAQFEQEPNALARFTDEAGFFRGLKPTRFAKALGLHLDRIDTAGLYILTASPNDQADQDKRDWVAEHLPQLHDRVVTVRDGKDKARLARGGNILIDDYTENLKHWFNSGGKGIKAINGYNGKTKRYKEYTTSRIRVD